MSQILTTAHETLMHLAQVIPADIGIDDLGSVAPDGVKGKVSSIVAAARWAGGVVAVLGLIGIGASWMVANHRQQAGEKAGSLGWWAAGVTLVGACLSLASWMIG